MPQDQLFKELIQEFFREFMELFYPDIAARLDFGTVSFLDKERFTDLPEGVRREADLVAQVQTKTGEPELISGAYGNTNQAHRRNGGPNVGILRAFAVAP